MKLSIISLKYCTDCFYCCHSQKGELASRSPTILAAIDISDVIYIFGYDRSSSYFTVNQWKIKISPKITQIF